MFINDAFTKGLEDYLNSKDNMQGISYNSFLVVVIRLLTIIYGELDILNPYTLYDEELLKSNMQKYGYSLSDLEMFFTNLQFYYNHEIANSNRQIKLKNEYFIETQKNIIDMFIKKKINYELSMQETVEFYGLLYTPYAKNPLQVSYNFLTAEDPVAVDNYYKKMMMENVKQVVPEEKHFLNIKAYELLNYSMEDLQKLTGSDVDKLNLKVYDYFHIRENAINKEYLLEKALEQIEREKYKVTSGNGYVDILLIMSVVATVVMVGIVITCLVL